MWLAVSRRRIYGPIFFHDTMIAEKCRQQILELFIQQFRDEELHLRYFQQDGATAHTAGATLE